MHLIQTDLQLQACHLFSLIEPSFTTCIFGMLFVPWCYRVHHPLFNSKLLSLTTLPQNTMLLQKVQERKKKLRERRVFEKCCNRSYSPACSEI
jgi:hypothetical protein